MFNMTSENQYTFLYLGSHYYTNDVSDQLADIIEKELKKHGDNIYEVKVTITVKGDKG